MSEHVSVRRYTEDGELDATFGGDGVLRTDVSAVGGQTVGVVVDEAARVVVGGAVTDGDRTRFALARYRDDGTLDPSYGENGRVLTQFLTGEAKPVAVAIDTAGRTVIAGDARIGEDTRFAVSRYAEDGSLDTGFDWDGAVLSDYFAARGERGHAVATDDRNRVLVAGRVRLGDTTRLVLVRYGAGGWHDSFFDWDSGRLSDVGLADGVGRTILTPRTGIVVVGTVPTLDARTQYALAKYRHDGRPAESFGDEGAVLTDFADGTNERIVGIDRDRRDRIVVAGTARNESGARGIAVARYTEDGIRDATFDEDGAVLTHLPDAPDLRVRGVAVDRCEKVVVVGTAVLGSERRFVAVRYNPDGSLDGTFGDDGVVTTAVRPPRAEHVRDVAIDSRGRVVVSSVVDAGTRDGQFGGRGLR